MTDAELIQLVQEKSPDELTPDEIGHLRRRLADSAELREVIFGQLHLEETLSQALGGVQVSVDQILATATRVDTPANRTAALIGWAICVSVSLFALFVLVLIARDAPQIAERKHPEVIRIATSDAVTPRRKSSDKSGPPTDPRLAATSREAIPPVPSAASKNKSAPTELPATPATASTKSADPPLPVDPPANAWPELFQDNGQPQPPVPLGDLVPAELRGLGQNELRRWLAPVAGQTHKILERPAAGGTVTVSSFEGLLRLKAPWPADAVLHLAPFDHQGLVIYFWSGEQGVSLHYYQYPRPLWAAYQITRRGNEPRPLSYALIATDNDRYDRSGQGTIEFRHQDGTLVLSRGDLRLLTAPLVAPPLEVYFDKRASFRAFTMYRGLPVPDPLDGPAPNVLTSETPAALEWIARLPSGSEFNESNNQWVELAADKNTEPAWIAVRVPRPGLYEIIFEVDGATPGTGVHLGDEQGKPLHRVAFLREQRTGWAMLGYLPVDRNGFEATGDINNQPVPLAGERQWLRLVIGSGNLKCWTSGDGIHWSRAFDPQRSLRGGCASVGLFCEKTANPADKRRRIALRRLQVRELAVLSNVVSAELRESVPAPVTAGDVDLEAWCVRTLESRPAGVNSTDWLHACALRTLAAVPAASLGNLLLSGLLEDRLGLPSPVELRLRLLNQAAQLFDAGDQPESARFAQLYERLGKHLIREGHPQPYTVAGQALITAPIWTSAQLSAMPESLVRAEILQLACAEKQAEALALCDRLRFWNQSSNPDARWPDQRLRIRSLVDWTEGTPLRPTAGRSRRDRGRPEPGSPPLPSNGRHPLIVELSKEGFNTLAEMQAALSEESFRDACQIISSARPELALGLLPDAKDARLMASLPQAVAAAMRDHPALRQTMVDDFGKLGRLRVQQAIADANPLALKAATVQFLGTEAAAEAHLWMGDRALAGGDFALAIGEYELGARSASAVQRTALAARLRLAAAMLGRDQGEPVAEPVALHETQLAAVDFEKLIAEMKQRATSATSPRTLPAESLPPPLAVSPRPARYTLQPRGNAPPDAARASDVDGSARQLATRAVGNILYVSNRLHVAAIDLTNGQTKWSESLGGEQGDAQRWPLVAMPPVIAGDRLFVRRLTRYGPELASLETATGKVLWKARPGDHVASDPLLIQDDLFAFTVSLPRDGLLQLELTTFNPLTGAVTSQRPLIHLLDAWEKQVPCQAVAVGGRLIATVGGSVVYCDLTGQPLWVRRQTWFPTQIEPAFFVQQRAAPLVADGRVYVAQPGVPSVECLDAESGRLLWQRSLPDVRRILGLAGKRLVVETADGLQAFAAVTGERLWQHDAGPLLDGHLIAATGDILYTRREQVQPDQWRPTLVWLDPATGRETARWPLESLTDKQPLLGPLFAHQEKLFMFFGRSPTSRELMELVPTAAAPYPGHSEDLPLAHWTTPRVAPHVLWAAASILPGWSCLGGTNDAKAGLRPEVQGEKEVCALLATRDRPVTLAREVTLPAGSKAKLALHVGHDPNEKWKLDIRIAGRPVQTQLLEAKATANGWKKWEIDLAPYAGQTVWLTLQQQPEGNPATGYWKRLEIVH